MLRGFWLYLGIGILAVTPYAYPPLGGYAVATLMAYFLLLAVAIGRRDRRRR